MNQFSKKSSEYITNGHYVIDGISFYSIWAYKNKHGIQPNTNSDNGTDAILIHKNDVVAYNSMPDFGKFDNVLLFSEKVLDDFYNS